MIPPVQPIDIFLQQGEVYFGGADTRIRTILGSCVAVTAWHPELHIGGMCHYILPSRRARSAALHYRAEDIPIHFASRRARALDLDGKYADEALELMFSEMHRNGARPREFQIKLFGGGNMFPHAHPAREQHVGLKNVEAGRELLARHGLKPSAQHLGGIGHRNLIFEIWNGHVWMKHETVRTPPISCATCEAREACLHA
jgi:chemotaxis protein CheD